MTLVLYLNYSIANLKVFWQSCVLTEPFCLCHQMRAINMITHLQNARLLSATYCRLLSAKLEGVVVNNFPFSDSEVQAEAHKCSDKKKLHAEWRKDALLSFYHQKNMLQSLHPVCHIISAILVVAYPWSFRCLASGNNFSKKQQLNEACSSVQSRVTT